MVFDIPSRTLRKYIRNFVPEPFQDNGNGYRFDRNRIDRLLIDQGRLITLTFSGKNSRIVRLSDLLADGK